MTIVATDSHNAANNLLCCCHSGSYSNSAVINNNIINSTVSNTDAVVEERKTFPLGLGCVYVMRCTKQFFRVEGRASSHPSVKMATKPPMFTGQLPLNQSVATERVCICV